jgi:hypothetical protein
MEGQLELFNPSGPFRKEMLPRKDICVSRHRGAETSREAFATTAPETRSRQRELVFGHIQRAGDRGATCQECSDKLGIPYTAASARITELQAEERIHWTKDVRRPTRSGKTARVYFLGPRQPEVKLP